MTAEPENEDAPRPAELKPRGGNWSGTFFDNPHTGFEPALTWTFEFDLGEVERDYGDTDVSFTVDWVPLPGAAWDSMAGREASGAVFAEPIETSAYFFEHYRYDRVQLRIAEQDGRRLRVTAEASGDVDGLGVPTWSVDDWLDFEGIRVSVSDVETVEDAGARLRELTDLSGLKGEKTGAGIIFRPR